jgi:hypothetical protein
LGIGPQIGFLFPVEGMQGYLNFKAYAEFDGYDRSSGWNAWVTFSISPGRKCSDHAATDSHEIRLQTVGENFARSVSCHQLPRRQHGRCGSKTSDSGREGGQSARLKKGPMSNNQWLSPAGHSPVAYLGPFRVREFGRLVFAPQNRQNELHCSSAPAIRKRRDITAVALDNHFANA